MFQSFPMPSVPRLRIRRAIQFATACIAAVAICAKAATLSDPALIVDPLITGLNGPTGVRFIDSDEALVIQKNDGKVVYWREGNPLTTALDLQVNGASERGLLGIALDPAFSINRNVYLYYSTTSTAADSTSTASWVDNRLVRYTWDPATRTLVGGTTLGVFGVNDPNQANGPNHNGGPLIFGPDGKLYGATGDLNRNRAEQNNLAAPTSSSDVGGIYRLNTDGSIPSDAVFSPPFSQWHAYGVRNSFGLTFDPVTGKLWDTENGPGTYDEINLVDRGFNSGWNPIQGPDVRDPQNAPGDLVMLPGAHYADPKFSFFNPIGITSLKFLAGSSWGPSYDNALLFADNNNGQLYLLRLNAARDGFVLAGALADGVVDNAAERNSLVFGNDFGVVTDLQIGPDGNVYVASLTQGTVHRIAPIPEAETWAMLLAGLGFITLAVRRRPPA